MCLKKDTVCIVALLLDFFNGFPWTHLSMTFFLRRIVASDSVYPELAAAPSTPRRALNEDA